MSGAGHGAPRPLSGLVGGVRDAWVVFGADGERVAVGELTDGGTSLFSGDADADRVGVLMTNDRPTVEVVLGALLSGVRLVSLPLPGRGADLEEYAASIRGACAHHGLTEVVAADDVAALLQGVGVRARPHSALRARPLAVPQAGGFELVQFTSGSTGRPRPVVLSDLALGANVEAILAVVAPQPGDALVSWLPLAHDMGLVGMLLAGLAAARPEWAGGGDLVLLDPREFLRRPAVWVEALSRWKGAFTAAPDFGLRMAAHRARGAGPDLSSLRCVIVGGEIVRADTLDRFSTAFAGGGFDPVALCPAYGMAEVAVAATLTPPAVHWRERVVDAVGLADNLVRAPRRDDGARGAATRLVASGRALPGYEVTDRAADGPRGPATTVSRLAVRGPSVGVDGTTGAGFAHDGGWFPTGDAGFVEDGWVHVCGRVDDWVVANGRNLYAPALEAAVGGLAGVRAGRVTAVGVPTGGWVVVAEPASRSPLSPAEVAEVRQEVRRTAVDSAAARPDDVVVVAPGTLPLTASGKVQRHQVRTLLLRDALVEAGPAAPSGGGAS